MMKYRNLTWLAAIPPGWHAILSEAIDKLHDLDPGIRIVQAKEKWASLRIYLDRGSPETYAIVDAATVASQRTCEICAATGALMRTPDGYFATRCPSHAAGFSAAEEQPSISVRLHLGEDGRQSDADTARSADDEPRR